MKRGILRPGDIVRHKKIPRSLYMVIRTKGNSVFCIGVNSKGLLETNDTDFVNLGDFTFGPSEYVSEYKKMNISYEPGSYFDYCYRVIVKKEFDILTKPDKNSTYINIIQVDENIWIDPTKNTHEEYYKPYFGKHNGIWI